MMTKYDIQSKNLYNFDETDFMMGVVKLKRRYLPIATCYSEDLYSTGVIISSMVITRSDRREKIKSV